MLFFTSTGCGTAKKCVKQDDKITPRSNVEIMLNLFMAYMALPTNVCYSRVKVNDIQKKSRDTPALSVKKISIIYKIWYETATPTVTTEAITISLIRMFKLGPEVSLNGSPTVSPITVAL